MIRKRQEQIEAEIKKLQQEYIDLEQLKQVEKEVGTIDVYKNKYKANLRGIKDAYPYFYQDYSSDFGSTCNYYCIDFYINRGNKTIQHHNTFYIGKEGSLDLDWEDQFEGFDLEKVKECIKDEDNSLWS